MSGNGDIVSRLRWKGAHKSAGSAGGLLLNAADEIERLQGLLRRYEDSAGADEVVERVAVALYEAQGCRYWEERTESAKSTWRDQARAALAAGGTR